MVKTVTNAMVLVEALGWAPTNAFTRTAQLIVMSLTHQLRRFAISIPPRHWGRDKIPPPHYSFPPPRT